MIRKLTSALVAILAMTGLLTLGAPEADAASANITGCNVWYLWQDKIEVTYYNGGAQVWQFYVVKTDGTGYWVNAYSNTPGAYGTWTARMFEPGIPKITPKSVYHAGTASSARCVG